MDLPDHQELAVEVSPCCELGLTWESSGGKLGKKQQLLNREIHAHYHEHPDTWLLYLGGSQERIPLSPSLSFFRSLARCFLDRAAACQGIEELRHRAEILSSPGELEGFIDAAPLMIGWEYINLDMLRRIWEMLHQGFTRGIQEYPGTVREFLQEFSPSIHLAGRVYFHLVENRQEDYPFQFLATYAPAPGDTERQKHRPLHYALKEYSGDELLDLLATVTAAARQSDLIKDLMDTGELFHHLAWDSRDAHQFLQQVELFEACGIICRIPDWWKKNRPSVRLSVRMGNLEPSHVGMDALLDFNASLMIGDDPVSQEEAREILLQTSGLAWIKNRWVEVDRDRLRQVLAAYDKAMALAESGSLTIRNALQFQLNPEQLRLADTDIDMDITHGDWLSQVTRRLAAPALIPPPAVPETFKATLRPYQEIGLNWLSFLDSLKFGACLADDMGLGKTLQVLGLLSLIQVRHPDRMSLLIVPASLVANWQFEIQRFLPGLACFVAHPGSSGQPADALATAPEPDRVDLVITTYAMVQRYPWIGKIQWRCLILDEAQAIKNPSTKQTRQVKKLRADTRIIMTGTPIENSLSDLWSLFDFLNPGLLGSAKAFKTFAGNLRKNPSGYKRLKNVIAPYILRRMKTDTSVVPDLPPKVEMKTFPELSKKQVILYTDFVEELKKRLAASDRGMERKGLILASLMKFKQICNHPDHFLGTGGFDPDESGKFIRLGQLCETIHAKRERVLVFTQFKEMISPLAAFLDQIFQRQGCQLHGSMTVRKRAAEVERFQGADYVPYMVLSLKAGGVGLNLTRANHVIHFDRWWNPAVENQATDRAFRIGQANRVLVHKFITRGTIEDHIDGMIESKKAMADAVVPEAREGWITELDNSELVAMFSLSL